MTSAPSTIAPEAVARRRTRLAWIILVASLVIGLVVILAAPKPRPKMKSIDITGVDWGRDFRLHDADGKVRTLADFRGRAVLLFFGFTQCPDVCPTTMARASDVVQRLGRDGDRLQVLFVTLDPERDTPELLKGYTRAFDPRFVGLTDTSEAIAAAAKDFRIDWRRVPSGSSYTLDHTAISYVFDPAGRLRLAVSHTEDAGAIASDVESLLAEARS